MPDEPTPRSTPRDTDPLGIWAYRPDRPIPGAPGGPLSGLTFSVKDLYHVPGWPLRASSRAPLPHVPPSPLVDTLLRAGAELTGSTHLHEIALGVTGTNAYGGTRNPLDSSRVAGGSSGGAAASVASGQVDFALGTDTGGSIRVPAALCGVFGFKPTYGLYPADGILPLSVTCDHPGPLARDMSTIARVHEAVTGQRPQPQPWAGVRVGLWNVEGWTTPRAWREVLGMADRLRAQGATVEPFEFPDVMDTYTPIVLSEAAAVHAEALALPEPGFTPRTLDLLRRGMAYPPQEVHDAHARREQLRQQLHELFGRFDVLLAPAVPDVAPHEGQEEMDLPAGRELVRVAILRLTAPWSLLGAPTVSVPLPVDGLSAGAQLIAPWSMDARLLGLLLADDARTD